MTEGEFFAGIIGSDSDLKRAVEALRSTGQKFCLIGGLAVNHYAEPMVTLDADFAISADAGIAEALRGYGFVVEAFPRSINAQLPGSKLRLQITTDPRYARFPERAVPGHIFDVAMPVASLEDLVQGKLWAFEDQSRRASKRAKDRADLIRLCETRTDVVQLIRPGLIPEVDELRNQI